MKITRAVVPSLFTVLNMFCGFLAIIQTTRGEYRVAAWLIILAAICDVLDGAMARLTKSYSNFGVEFDSLSDVISFGAAPSILVYYIHLHSLDGLGTLISAMPMVLGATRLARFNSQLVGYDKDYFKGLPIPSTALVLCSYVLKYYNPTVGFSELQATLLVPIVIILSLLMVSTIKYDNVPRFTRRGLAQHPLRFGLGLVAVTAIIITQGDALFPVFAFYLATGPLRYITDTVKHLLHPESKNEEETTEGSEITSVDV